MAPSPIWPYLKLPHMQKACSCRVFAFSFCNFLLFLVCFFFRGQVDYAGVSVESIAHHLLHLLIGGLLVVIQGVLWIFVSRLVGGCPHWSRHESSEGLLTIVSRL